MAEHSGWTSNSLPGYQDSVRPSAGVDKTLSRRECYMCPFPTEQSWRQCSFRSSFDFKHLTLQVCSVPSLQWRRFLQPDVSGILKQYGTMMSKAWRHLIQSIMQFLRLCWSWFTPVFSQWRLSCPVKPVRETNGQHWCYQNTRYTILFSQKVNFYLIPQTITLCYFQSVGIERSSVTFPDQLSQNGDYWYYIGIPLVWFSPAVKSAE